MLGHLIQVINASIFPGLAHYIETANKDKIIEAYNRYSNDSSLKFPPVFGDGKAAEFICDMMLKHLS
jgi:hypothetical protein